MTDDRSARLAREDAGAVLLTGATGFLGMEVLARYLERTDRKVYALVRAGDPRAAQRRLQEVLARLFGSPQAVTGRVVAIPGDLQAVRLGLTPRLRAQLADEVTDVIHAAASVSFELALRASRQINVEGTRSVLELCEHVERRGRLRGVTHVSTAYVAGRHRGSFHEDQRDVGQSFHNAYERSKFEAEQLVHSRAGTLPVRVVRPSIIVGEQSTGWTASFNVIYWPLRAFARSGYIVLPARAEAPVDVVPVDYVADAIFALSQRGEAAGETLHLTAGEHTATVGAIIALAAARFGRRVPRLLPPQLYGHCVHPLLLTCSRGAQKQKLRRSEVFFPYFAFAATYDNAHAREALEPDGIRPTALATYFDRLMDFAVRAEWGRKQLAREHYAPARRLPPGLAA